MYGSKTIIVILALYLGYQANGQALMTSAEVEKKTKELTVNKNWDELIALGRQALQQDIDYFYLRLRLGIAFYEKKQYRAATTHFEKALAFNSSDELAQEYLYYSLIFSERFDEANNLMSQFNNDLLRKVAAKKPSAVSVVAAEGAMKVSSRSDLFDPAYYFQFGLGHTVANKFSLFHAVTRYSQSESRGDISQWQYFLQAGIPTKKGWTFAPAIHLVKLDYVGTSITINKTYFVGSINVAKAFAHADISLGTTYSNVGGTKQYIPQGRLAIYPLGKQNLSVGTIAYLHSEDEFSTSTLALNPFVSWSPVNNVRLMANHLMNKTKNMVEMNGYLVNNSQDLSTSRTTVLLSVSPTRRWEAYGVYQFENKQDANALEYTYNLFLIGLKFKP
jgi:hypothetical protein